MESLSDVITRAGRDGDNISKSELLENWQAIRAMGMEMREWMRPENSRRMQSTRRP